MKNQYRHFLESKKRFVKPVGFEPQGLNQKLFDFQKAIVRWACKKGRAALFEDCGMGKTFQQLEWAREVSQHTDGRVLILAPLAVVTQTAAEGERFGIDVRVVSDGSEVDAPGVYATNYQKLHRFDDADFSGVVLDESSILKSFDGKYRKMIQERFESTHFKLAATATPAPNDFMELGTHAEFLGAMSRQEMLATYFVHDGGRTSNWRLKKHATSEFWKWVCSWAVMIKRPSDIGFSDGNFILPELRHHSIEVIPEKPPEGLLFHAEAQTLTERRNARRSSIDDRVSRAAALANSNCDQWLIWCDLNDESKALASSIDGAVEVTGSDSDDHKTSTMMAFSRGEVRVLVTKPKIAGFGMNWQNCSRMIFVGLSDSFEQVYQATRRCWRFGQDKPVDVYVVTATTEGAVVANIKRKEQECEDMAQEMVQHMSDISRREISQTSAMKSEYERAVKESESGRWTVHLGDCVDVYSEMPDASVGYSIFSPPFASLYTYSNSDRDMGNCLNHEEFHGHFSFLVSELFRVTMPGRLVSFHCMNLPTSKTRDGYIGITDFRGILIKAFQDAGWIYHSEVTIWKDPVTAMQRTKALGLLHKQLKKDSCMSRQGIPDYLVTMRKPGDNPERVSHTNDSFPVQLWQQYASPVWMDINPSDTLQFRSAREHDDERHICPLQLEVIRRAMKLWSKEDDLVSSPFTGIGSEGFIALEMGRRFIGSELKRSYFDQACKNLAIAEHEASAQMSLFASVEGVA